MPMISATRAFLRSACLPGPLRLARAAVLASGLLSLSGAAAGALITNTASASFTGPSGATVQTSNTTSLSSVPLPSPALVTFYQYAPGTSGGSLPFDGGRYDSGGGSFSPLASPVALDGSPISLAGPVEVRATRVYHLNEPVFITLADANRNTDPAARELIKVTVTSQTGDRERLLLQETGADTGVFAAVIPSNAGTATADDGFLTLATNSRITVDYQDPLWPGDTSASAALVDPFGFLFDSVTGLPLNGGTVTLLDTTTGLPAQVFGDDGVSSFPSTLVTGGTVTDGGGQTYNLPDGGYRFPFVRPGNYRFVVTPPVGYTVPSTVPTGSLANDPAGNPYAIETGSRGEVFVVLPGPALHIDTPADPTTAGLFLQKLVSQTQASAGDFLQYRLLLQNITLNPATAATVTDRLPPGMRYQAGSLRVNGQKGAEPAISADGRGLTFGAGNLAAGATAQISYVAQLGAGVLPGDAVNTASAGASAIGGGLSSNVAQVAVRIREPLMSGRFTLIGRVYEGDCSTPWQELRGVANARILLEDGSYVVTDKDGQYHFEGVRPGTHVVQLDVDSLPNGLEPVACMENTRFAGRNFSQFVDVKGGGLWRADFFTRARRSTVGIRMQSRLSVQKGMSSAEAAPVEITLARQVRDYTLRAEFDSCRATLKPDGEADVQRLIESLSGEDIKRIELVGNTDNQRLSVRCREQFKDNHELSEARARTVGEALAAGLFLKPEQIKASGRGPDAPVASNKTPEGMARNRRTEVRIFLNEGGSTGGDNRTRMRSDKVSRVTGMSHRIELDGSSGVDNLRITAMLPDGAAYRRGSARVDGQPVGDPVEGEGFMTFSLGGHATPGWASAIEFDSIPLAPVAAPRQETRQYVLRARFESCSDVPHKDGEAAIAALVAKLRGQGRVESLELIGHGDNQTLSASCQQLYPDTQALSLAQARSVGNALSLALGLSDGQVRAEGRGGAEPLASNDSAAGRANNRRIDVIARVTGDIAAITADERGPVECPASAYPFKALASFEAAGRRGQTPRVETRVGCPTDAAADDRFSSREEDASPRQQVEIAQHAEVKALPPELQARQKERLAIRSDADAAGAEHDWLTGAAPGIAWLFPQADHNPRSPAVRIVIKHAPGQTVKLRQADGSEVSGLNFDGTETSADRKVMVSTWRGVSLKDGANAFRAEVYAADGALVETLSQTVHYANAPVRAVLRPEKSILLADGLNRPVLAVQLLDRDGRPVRAGVTGPVTLSAPYRSWAEVEQEQKRQLAGLDRFSPMYKVEGDEGIAYIELAPTTESGSVQMDFSFQLADDNSARRQELRAWLEPQARDWVVVGFAEGTLGYNTLKDNSQGLGGQVEDGGYSDGQVSLYAKGRVLGKWLLTMAYDSDKPRRTGSLLGTIDPDEYYTLYGDGTEQRYDAPSQDRLYLKLERGQFYALFGDYETGLTQTQLSRYSRSLNGLKSEKANGPVVFTAFAAETPQNFARDEIQGNGTSGLYRLAQRGIVLNSEKIRIETRDRLHSEKILVSRQLTRHIDYDIDYGNGTLFFRQPVNSRDTNFNPTFIVAEYETMGVAREELNAGGRVGLVLNEGKAQVGVSAIHDESNLSSSDLGGADLTLRVGKDSELRMEVAQTKGQVATLSPEGMAWLSEFEHHSGRYDALIYARRQEPGFGLNQQSLSEAGQQKLGVEGQVRFARNWSVFGQLYQQESLGTQTTRDAAQTKLQYKTDLGGASVGVQAIQDSTDRGVLAGQDFRSEQLTAAVNRFFLDRKLELSAQAESGLGGSSQSVDFPNRYLAGASYAITSNARLLVGQEFTEGGAFDTSTSRVGLQVVPWKGARLDSTLNQSRAGEYGPRTFGLFGLTQGLVLNDQWGVDFSVDSSQTLNESAKPVLVVNPAYPVAPGGTQVSTGVTEDFVAVSTGATYRTELWSWNGRLEDRNGETTERYGMVSNFLRQAQAGVAFASSAQLFRSEQASGTDGLLASLDLSWAWRPLGVQWSVLDRLEFRFESVENGSGAVGSGVFGNNSLTLANAETRRIINNFALNRVSREWRGTDRTGNLFRRYERSQLSFYYGSKYALDTFDGVDYDGYTDLIGLEARHDVKPWLDIGLQASSLNAWTAHSHAYSFGPMIGASPVTNGWITLGWNLRGFTDSDFDAARYTAQGPYLQLRFKFDQNTRFGTKSAGRASATDSTNTRAGE